MSNTKITPWYKAQITGKDKTPAHLRCATKLTKYGEREESSRLLRRHGSRKKAAKLSAVLNMPVNGVLPVPGKARGTYHIAPVTLQG